MKRFRVAEVESINNMARALMLLSQRGSGGGGGGGYYEDAGDIVSSRSPSVRVFECKTCNRQFSSFQALGGHRASHKKPKLAGDGRGPGEEVAKTRVHECSVCGLEFAIGQALGGHMRRHRSAAATEAFAPERKADDGKRVPWLDLNVPPSEVDVSCRKKIFGFELVDTTPVVVDCFH